MSADWPAYRSHKIIHALPIVRVIAATDAHPFQRLFVEPEAGRAMEEFVPTEAGMANRVTVGDYAVRYPDGFKSVSPQKAFTDGYTLNE